MNRLNVSSWSENTPSLKAPVLLNLMNSEDLRCYQELLNSANPPSVNDNFEGQLVELFKSRVIGKSLSESEHIELLAKYTGETSLEIKGIWAYYPWLHQLIHILPESEFIELRTNRNRNKITQNEQDILAQKVVGIVGLSVGRSVAITIAQERIAGEIRLADFDDIELSNLNRIRSGLNTLGVNKAIAAAREISLIDPYLKVRVFTEGLLESNMDQFFLEQGKLDLLVEECDTVQVKISSRIKAKSLGVPVVMDTSDRGMLDVERFDLEPERPLLHGWIDHLDLGKLKPEMSNEEKIPFLAPMLGIKNVSPRLKASVLEVGHSLYTWPQLATSVTLGGAVAADVSRRILLGSFNESGRWYVDIEGLINGGSDNTIGGLVKEPSMHDLVKKLPALSDLASDQLLTSEEQKILINAGILAPSAGNLQPWRFAISGQTIHLLHDINASNSVFDADHMIADLGLGACIENIITQAKGLGISMAYELFPIESPLLAASIYPVSRIKADVKSSQMIETRMTDRSVRKRRKLSPEERLELLNVDVENGCRLKYFGDDLRLQTLASLTGQAERLRVLNPMAHKELFEHEINWGTKDNSLEEGLDIDTLGLTDGQLVGMHLARDPRAIALLKAWELGSLFKKSSLAAILNSCGLLLVTSKGRKRTDRLRAGMSLERAWLHANELGYAVHPVSAAIFLSQHNETSQGVGFDQSEKKVLSEISAHLKRVFELGVNEHPQFLIRVSDGGEPTKRSLRRSIHESIVQLQASSISHDKR